MKLLSAILLLAWPLAAQVPVPPTEPVPPAPPAALQVPEPDWIHGKYQSVISHTLPASANGSLTMVDLQGDVAVLGTDGEWLEIREIIRVKGAASPDEARQMIARSTGVLSIEIPNEPAAYRFTPTPRKQRHVSFDYLVQVPRPFSVAVKAYAGDVDLTDLVGDLLIKTGSGDIGLSDCSGKIEVQTGAGDIDAVHIEGRIELNTGAGDVEARHAKGQITVNSGGGDIKMVNSEGSFDINTGGGGIDLRNITGDRVTAKTGGGDIDLQSVTAAVNVISKGGDISVIRMVGNLEVATGGGDVDAEDTDGDLVILTRGGDIMVERVSGLVQVKTNAGDITIEEMTLKNPGDRISRITSGSGDIYVSYDINKPVQVEARLHGYSPRYAANRFKGNLEMDLLNEDGSTLGIYKVDEPYHTIEIETTGGTIEIVRGRD